MLKNCEFYVDGRGTGKTSNLMDNFVRLHNDGYDCLYIDIQKNNQLYWSWLNQHFTFDDIKGKEFDYILIDEYLAFNVENIVKCNALLPLVAENIIIRTSATKLINKDLLKLAKFVREKGLNNCLNVTNFELYYLFQNLISHPKTTLKVLKEDQKRYLGDKKDAYRVCVGELYKD